MSDEHELLYEKLKAKEVELEELNKLYMDLLESQTERQTISAKAVQKL